MKFWQAFRIFRYLLHSEQWFIVAEDKYKQSHMLDANINTNQLVKVVNNIIEEAEGQEAILQEAKNILSN